MRLFYSFAIFSLLLISCSKDQGGAAAGGNGAGGNSGVKTPEPPFAVTVIGDSYSTYDGWNNVGNGFNKYYPTSSVPDITDVSQTWWHQLCQTPEFDLEKLNTYSGSTISYKKGTTLFPNMDKRAFCARLTRTDMGSPEVILIFGGTNDSWHNTDDDIGSYKYEGWVYEDLQKFRPAFAYMIATLKKNFPNAYIYNITNSGRNGMSEGGLTAAVADSMAEICKHYGIMNIVLSSTLDDGGKTSRHPNLKGMQIIYSQVYAALKKDLGL